MLSRFALSASLLAAALYTSGCAAKSSGLPNAPIFTTGASATIISPGQQAPPMPGFGQRTATSGPGSTSGSYSGIPGASPGSGVPGQPQGYPSSQQQRVPTSQQQAVPTGQPPLGSDMAMLGGAVTIDTRNIRKSESALWSNPLFLPFAVVAWPFVKLNEALTRDRDAAFRQRAFERIEAQTGVPIPREAGMTDRASAQLAAEQAQQQAMEQALLARQQAGADGAAPGFANTAPTTTLSIADELTALRSGSAPGAVSRTPTPAAPSAGAAPIPGAAAADEVEDRSGDGRPDRWVYRSDGRTRELLDEDGDGRPERTVYYEPGSDQIARIDEDTTGDGQVDSWTSYEAGEIARRRADTNGDGEPDTWTLYQAGQISRHEQDSQGTGVRDRIDYYENGALLRRTEDADGDGRPERITHFDTKGRPASLEEDSDGDGLIDVRSYYSGGKLVRRELLDETSATP